MQLTGASIDSGLGGRRNVGILGVFDVHVVTKPARSMKATNFPTGAILGKALATSAEAARQEIRCFRACSELDVVPAENVAPMAVLLAACPALMSPGLCIVS